jgi:hypothetical protein
MCHFRIIEKALLSLGVVLLITHSATARDITMDNLLGHWCGTRSNYTFTTTRLTVDLHGGGALPHGSVLEIEKVEIGDGWINIKWKNDGNTVFWKFSNDGREMYQRANDSGDMGPERRYHRC